MLDGKGLLLIPGGATGIVSFNNDEPLERLNDTSGYYSVPIMERFATRLLLRPWSPHGFQYPYYLGAIVSADRQTIYWVNNSRPLP